MPNTQRPRAPRSAAATRHNPPLGIARGLCRKDRINPAHHAQSLWLAERVGQPGEANEVLGSGGYIAHPPQASLTNDYQRIRPSSVGGTEFASGARVISRALPDGDVHGNEVCRGGLRVGDLDTHHTTGGKYTERQSWRENGSAGKELTVFASGVGGLVG